ncbi:MAG: response regulator [Acidobacteria bacterium]|nr:MAG: response regulator [Acidobacteriota bacterium]PYT89155.1 MAG: response regulator [Acidobacteriota bacterium]
MSWWHRTGTENMGKVVALVDDLFFQMKLAETAKQLGLDVKVAANGDALMGLLESAPKLVIVDLNARSQPLQAIARVRQASKDIRVVGFVSHVQTQLAAQAQAAGCNEVLPRSSFAQNLAAILSASKD